MTQRFYINAKMVFVLLGIILCFQGSYAQITWPSGQLLPSFTAPAQTQDLIYLREKSSKWEAEGSEMSHNTGRLETDGWLCQVSIDSPRQHMLFGPYVTDIPSGANTATFRIKTDNNTVDNSAVVDIDVRDATSGTVVASQTITRQQFSVAGDYVNFSLPFTLSANDHKVELRVYWYGSAYTKVDWVSVAQNNSTAEMYLFASLKGIVNRTQPRIFSYEGDDYAEGSHTWLESLGLNYTEYTDNWQLITKYKNEIEGIIVYDPSQIHTVNLATVMEKDHKALIASPSLAEKLRAVPYNFPVIADLRGQYTSKIQVYQKVFDEYWPKIDHRVIIGLDPNAHKASLREYAAAIGAGVIWLDPSVAEESTLLNSFLSSMPESANVLGWWPEEGAGITRASSFGIATIASDYCSNLSMHSGTSRVVTPKPIPAKPPLENKIYVAFILSDGDNLQYVEHLMRKLWNDGGRGSVPMGWTVSPSMLDAMPGALNYYWKTATDYDELLSGPSGYGYTYPNDWTDQTKLDNFAKKTENYIKRAGLRIITVWNTITGGINQNVGDTYAKYTPSLLGLTAQNTDGGLTIYNNTLPGRSLSCNYCTSEETIKSAIASNAAGWDRSEPKFIIIQAQPWTDIKPSNFANVANSLDSNYKVVRPDHLFMLLRESKGLPVDPINSVQTQSLSLQENLNFAEKSIKLFPNPAVDKVIISGTKESDKAVIYDVGGRVVRSNIALSAGQTEINISKLQTGTYFIKLVSNQRLVLKFIKK